MDTLMKPGLDSTAEDVMSPVTTVSSHTPFREAAHSLCRGKGRPVAVVEESGRCIGLLCSASYQQWAEDGCPETVLDPNASCPYQLHGLLLTGEEATICTLSEGSCPFQVIEPLTAGRHSEVCKRPRDQPPPFGPATRYLSEVETVRKETLLSDLLRKLRDSHTDCLVVVDEDDRPCGVVSSGDILAAIEDSGEFGLARHRQPETVAP